MEARLMKTRFSALLESNDTLRGFFISMSSYFAETRDPDPEILELKFKELVLNVADNTANTDLLSYFCSLLHEPQTIRRGLL